MRRTLLLLPYPAILLLLLGNLLACPGGGSLDGDGTTVDDDDDDDDDDDAADDDDDSTPEDIAMSGELRYQPNDGPVPEGAIRVGFFTTDFAFAPGVEIWSAQVTEGGLTSGATVFTVLVDEAPPTPESVEDDTTAGLWMVFTYADTNADEAFNQGDVLLGSSDTFLAFIADTDGELPKDLTAAGAGAGWNTAEYDFFGDEEWSYAHVPAGTNSNNGPEVRSKLVATPGGDVPLSSDLEVPVGSNVAAFHSSLYNDSPAVENPQAFRVAVDNASGANPFAQWTVGGVNPPASHVGPLEDEANGDDDDDDSAGSDDDDSAGSARDGEPELMGASYVVTAWWDGEGDGDPETGECDLVLGSGNKTLTWVQPPGIDLELAFWMHLYSVRPGWLLFEGDLPRLLQSGVAIQPEVASGDDDDSAGDDDDSAGDSILDHLPDGCVPVGDDDDSAGDDDDSAGDDDDSAL